MYLGSEDDLIRLGAAPWARAPQANDDLGDLVAPMSFEERLNANLGCLAAPLGAENEAPAREISQVAGHDVAEALPVTYVVSNSSPSPPLPCPLRPRWNIYRI